MPVCFVKWKSKTEETGKNFLQASKVQLADMGERP